ncbi:uncharacterized protein LOC133187115 [Saccostrea echinata]|uniref:uncharacterized protein LOC133187115 n=1 Tax=Saccostrea echinata TaxID=191078 RepID=UPI002A7FF62E|nr:uncharacterized protein LOC133187115 [Saccostrea echinata]
MNSVVGALTRIMNCKISECDEADHVRHHMFVKSPADMYGKYIKQYFFGRKFLSSLEMEHLQTVLQNEMFCSKPLHGSIFTRYRTFQNLKNEELESILINSPLMAVHYFSLILLKEAIVYLICTKTGLPYEEADTRCSSTECSVKDLHL